MDRHAGGKGYGPRAWRFRPWVTCGLFLALAMFAGIAAAADWKGAAPIEVFVSILPQKYFAERIGGPHVAVSVMVGPGQSPATYEPTPRQMARLAKARLYFRIGVAFEDAWMGRIVAANPRMRVVDTRRGIPLRDVDSVVRETAPGVRKDPHVWTSPVLAKIIVEHMRDALVAADPAHRGTYEANCSALVAELERLDGQIRGMFRHLATRSFMVFHPSWGYFADTYGLKQIPIETGGKEPGARTIARFIELGQRQGVKVIFVQEQFSRRTAETVARAIGGRLVAVDPLAEDYLNNLRHVAQVFAESMGAR